jgi:predicted DNA-binding transcriptional regulator AlpA
MKGGYLMHDEWIDTVELAQRTRTAEVSWAKRRMAGGDATPKFSKIGRNVRYRWSDVEAWLETRQRQSTSEAA